jgi:hypothetical protein
MTSTARADGSISHTSETNPFWKVRQTSTGLIFERHSIDARDLLASGSFTRVLDGSASIRETLEALSIAQLTTLYPNCGRYPDSISFAAALVPLVERGTISLP